MLSNIVITNPGKKKAAAHDQYNIIPERIKVAVREQQSTNPESKNNCS